MVAQRLIGSAPLGLILLALAACTVGPNFKQPVPPSAASYIPPASGTPVASEPVAEPIDPAWWNIFHDAELISLENRVAAANLDVATATVRVAESRTQAGIVTASEYPTINGNASNTAERVSPRGIFGLFSGGGNSSGGSAVSTKGISLRPFDYSQYGLDASWEIDLWGKVRRAGEAATASSAEAEDNRRGALLSALAEVARDYIALRGSQTSLAIANRNIAIARQNLQLTSDRANNGLTSQLDVANAQAALSSEQAAIPSLQDQISELINSLSYLLGETPGALAPELSEPGAVPPTPPRVPVGVPSELAARRPDIRAASNALHAATAEIGIAQADFYPSISLTGSLDLQALQLKDLGNWGARTYAAGPALSLPIFSGGKLKAQLSLRRQQQQEAALSYQRTVLEAWREVDNALAAYRAEQQRRDQLKQSAAAQQQSLDLARDRYRQGLTDFLQVLDAQCQLLITQQQLSDSTTSVSTDLVALYRRWAGGGRGGFRGE